ncbi:MAG: PA domain-containing protein [Bacteroidota bacterium]|nr:PA domain-containing protein [Bacteroidota bacterium]
MRNIIFIIIIGFYSATGVVGQTRISNRELENNFSSLSRIINDSGAMAEFIKTEFSVSNSTFVEDAQFQAFEVVHGIEARKNNRLTIGNTEGVQFENYCPLSFSGNGSGRASLAFVGFGMPADSSLNNKSSYSGINVSGKWVVILRGKLSLKNKEINKPDSFYFQKAKLAEAQGATGVIFVSDAEADYEDNLSKLKMSKKLSQLNIPVIHAKRELVNRMFQMEGRHSVNWQAKLIRKRNSPGSFETHVSVYAGVYIDTIKSQLQNVSVTLKGTDTTRSKTPLVIGTAYGVQKNNFEDSINGGNIRRWESDYSQKYGLSGLFEMLEYYASKRHRPQRDIIFLAYADAGKSEGLRNYFSTTGRRSGISKPSYFVNLSAEPDSSSQDICVRGTAKLLSVVFDGTDFETEFCREALDQLSGEFAEQFKIPYLSVNSGNYGAAFYQEKERISKKNIKIQKHNIKVTIELIDYLLNMSPI